MRKNPITLRVKSRFTLESVIKAVEGLISYYENPRARRFRGNRCPFCRLFKCKKCLWAIFHHMDCEEFARKFGGSKVSHMKKDKKWRAFRVEELKCWLEELERPGVKVIKDA